MYATGNVFLLHLKQKSSVCIFKIIFIMLQLLYMYMTTRTQDARLLVQSTLAAFSSLFLLCYKQKILRTQERLMLEMTDEIRVILTACHSVFYNIQISWLSREHILKKIIIFFSFHA